MAHDIIDNRHETLQEHVQRILPHSERARIAVGYLFLSGLTPFRQPLAHPDLKEVRLLIGNATDRETIETLAEATKRLDAVQEAAEAIAYRKRTDMQRAAQATAGSLAEAVALMDQTDADEETVRLVLRLVQEKRLKVRVYTKGRLHAKAYIFDYGTSYNQQQQELPRVATGIAIVGSSNLTLAGVSHNTELNVVVHGDGNHAQLTAWFDELWQEAQEFDAALMEELKRSWVGGVVDVQDGVETTVRPYDIYMKTLYELVKDRLDEENEIVLEDDITAVLTDFQRDAVRRAIHLVRRWNGCFVADVVGLGKSYIGAAIVKHFEQVDNARPLIVCPASLVDMWERYNEVYQLNARVLSMGLLRDDGNGQAAFLDDVLFRERDFVLIDESHNFRHSDTQRYRALQAYLHARQRRCVLLTATPRNRSADDIYHQMRLFHADDRTQIPVDPPNLREYFDRVEDGDRRLPDLLQHVLIRRRREDVLRRYGFDAETDERVDPNRFDEYRKGQRRAYITVNGRKQFFPRRRLETIAYSIENTYKGLYQQLRQHMGRPRHEHRTPAPDELTYARYGLWNYVLPARRKQEPYASLHRAGANLRGLIRVMLFKRFESSVYAFRETLNRLLTIHRNFVKALDEGIVPAGEDAQYLLYESDEMEEGQFFDALRAASGRYAIADFYADRLRADIEQDTLILNHMLGLVEPIEAAQDDKLQMLVSRLNVPPLSWGKCLIFSQYADTARYLYDNLNPGGLRDDVEVVYSERKGRRTLVGRFAPKANQDWYTLKEGETELSTLVATDVLAEGLNLQDCDKVINYDLHWNPVRLIQRFGRIDRIGSEFDHIYAYNFLPEVGIEREIGLRATLAARIQEIHETIGEDAAILDPTEQLNEQAMYAIYEGSNEVLWQSDGADDPDAVVDLDEAEETIKRLREENPQEFQRISELRYGLRTGKASGRKGTFAFFRAGQYLQPRLLDGKGKTVGAGLGEVLAVIRSDVTEAAAPLPDGYNTTLMQAKGEFAQEVKRRTGQRDYVPSHTDAQRYVLRELRQAYAATKDEVSRGEMEELARAYSRSITQALKKDLNGLRRQKLVGEPLVKQMKLLYYRHDLQSPVTEADTQRHDETPRIVCSMALV